MMGLCNIFLISLLLPLLLFRVNCSTMAVEDDFEGVQTPKGRKSNHDDGSSVMKNVSPDVGEVNDEKLGKGQDDRSQQETSAIVINDTQKSMIDGNGKPLEEPNDRSGDLKKATLDEGTTKKKQPTIVSKPEGCDPSNRCIDKNNDLVACLRVPGTDLQALSLLVQNKGNSSFDIEIIAPPFVILEHSKMQIKAKEDKEVKVFIRDGNTRDSTLILQTGEGNCSLELKNIVPNSISQNAISSLPRFISTSSGYLLLYIGLSTALIACLAWLCLKFQGILQTKACSEYQNLEVGLPVSTEGMKEDVNGGDDGWENSWGDGWDDEEAPITPSKAITNPSLKGLASRRFNKDGWKELAVV